MPAANTTDDGEEVTDPFQNVEEVYIDYTDFIRVVKMRLEAMEVGGGTLLLFYYYCCCCCCCHYCIFIFFLFATNKQKILKDKELELRTDANSKVKRYQCPSRDCGAKYSPSDVYLQMTDRAVGGGLVAIGLGLVG